MPHVDPSSQPGPRTGDSAAYRAVAPDSDPAVPLDGMTIRDLVRELTWIQDQSRRQGTAGATADASMEWVDEDLLRGREHVICAELRRRRAGP